jgi:pimeloyl-ACP methyl ester carboxylesterase
VTIVFAPIAVPESDLADLRERLARTRWFDTIPEAGWSLGVDVDYVRGLVDYWQSDFDWYATQRRFNDLGPLATEIAGQRIHAFHVRSPRADATPLLLVHGWPGSVIEFIDCMAPLADPDRHGAPGAPAFHVVCPSIPGYGFSGPTSSRGWGIRRISSAFDDLMRDLGYPSYAAAGGDWGATIITDIARSDRASNLTGLHLTMPTGLPPAPGDVDVLTDFERESLAHWDLAVATGRVNHVNTNTHRPHTMTVAMNDSPAGLLAWLVDMCRSFTVWEGEVEEALTRDQLVANATIYWLTGTIASAARLYGEWAEQKRLNPNPPFVTTPTSVSIFPTDIRRWPRAWAERCLNVTSWEVMPVGGHFGSWEQPELFIDAVRRGLG